MEIRRRPPNPKVKVAHLEYAIPHEEGEPRNILEQIVWEKDREVATARERLSLEQLKKQVAELPPPATLSWGTVEPLQFETVDGLTLQGWRVRPRKSGEAAPAAPPVVLYFPGNAGHREYRLDEFELLVRSGAEVCCFDYRGYGENPGSPTEADLHRDARAAWNHLTRSLKIPERRIVLLGESLGGGVATHLAADLCTADEVPGGLVLRSTFNTLTSAASWHFPWLPVNWLLRDRFESDRKSTRLNSSHSSVSRMPSSA